MGDFLDFLLVATLVDNYYNKDKAARALKNMEGDYVWGDIEEDEDDLDEFNEYENEDFYDEY